MKVKCTLSLFLAALFLCGGCVRRTVIHRAEHRGADTDQKKFGASPHDKEVSTEIIWIWQDEFRNPR